MASLTTPAVLDLMYKGEKETSIAINLTLQAVDLLCIFKEWRNVEMVVPLGYSVSCTINDHHNTPNL